MQKFHLNKLFCWTLIGAVMQSISGCSSVNLPSNADTADLMKVAETSALVCDNNQLWTINDSGNSASLYQVDGHNSQLLRTVPTTARNQDWEALTLYNQQLIIADIGNNAGQRPDISLYLLPWPLPQQQKVSAQQIELRYPELPVAPLLPYQHNLDAEALAGGPDGLLLFSKNWLADSSTVYRIDLTAKTLTVAGEISGLPGMLTNASWSQAAQLYVATGYRNIRKHGVMFALTGDFQPFLALIDRQLQLVKTIPLDSQGQVEGVCIDAAQQIWLSQEQSDHHPLRFWRWGTVDEALAR